MSLFRKRTDKQTDNISYRAGVEQKNFIHSMKGLSHITYEIENSMESGISKINLISKRIVLR